MISEILEYWLKTEILILCLHPCLPSNTSASVKLSICGFRNLIFLSVYQVMPSRNRGTWDEGPPEPWYFRMKESGRTDSRGQWEESGGWMWWWCVICVVLTVEDTVGYSTTGGNGQSILAYCKRLAVWTGVLVRKWWRTLRGHCAA